jgi:hypothetical protein
VHWWLHSVQCFEQEFGSWLLFVFTVCVYCTGPLEFYRPEFACAGCGSKHRQNWSDFVAHGYCPASLDDRNRTYVHVRELQQLRAMHLHAVPNMHGRAATIDSVGREVYNQANTCSRCRCRRQPAGLRCFALQAIL